MRGTARMDYPGSTDCAQGCDFVSGGWPLSYLVDNPGISPRGSISLVDGLLGVDIIRIAPLLGTFLFWAIVWAMIVMALRRFADRRQVR